MKTKMRVALAAFILLLSPFAARAQQPVWPNTSDEGLRVIPAGPGTADHWTQFRAGSHVGIVPVKDSQDKSGTAPQLNMDLALGVSPVRGMEIFYAGVASYMSVHTYSSSAVQGPDDTVSNLGDAALGARYAMPIGAAGLNLGGEAALVFMGKATGQEIGDFSGSKANALSAYGRVLASYDLGNLRVSGNAGLYQDRSFNIWKDDPHPDGILSTDRRAALGIYGKDGTVMRPIFGLSAVRGGARAFRPYVEATAELTDGDLGLRLTPGFAFQPNDGKVKLLLSADLAPPIEHKSSPNEALIRVNAGLQMSLGDRAGGGGGTRRVKPPKNRLIKVTVVDENGTPLDGAKVGVVFAPGKPSPSATVDTGKNGVASFDASATPPYKIQFVSKTGYVWVNEGQTMIPTTDNPPQVTLYGPDACAIFSLALRDEKNAPIDRQVRLKFFLKSGTQLVPQRVQTWSPPVTAFYLPTGFDWKVETEVEGAVGPVIVHEGMVTLKGPTPKDPVIIPMLREDPLPVIGAAFDTDAADLRPGASRSLDEFVAITKEKPGRRFLVTVHIKKGGDKLFAETLAGARAETILNYLKSKGVTPDRVKAQYNVNAEKDDVSLDYAK